ncbi:MAG: hypothetical protein LBR08_04960 [Bacteroidales bacterium]|jgi:hypothetical protein|nr:hypothetical protein [Bacteroidales bacterium]
MSKKATSSSVNRQPVFIANPIYDTVFKNLMENERVAKFFISTLLDETIEEVKMRPQEVTVRQPGARNRRKAEKSVSPALELLEMTVLHYDFIATIRTGSGEYKKTLIEVQKAQDEHDVMRFRRYLAKQYASKDEIEIMDGVKTQEALPIVTIYMLGFKLPEVDAVALRVKRDYWDLINRCAIQAKSTFVESITHDSFIVQIPRIGGKTRTKLERLLSLFEQDNFVDTQQIIKTYHHPVSDEMVGEMLAILEYTGADPVQRKIIESEQELLRVLDVMSRKQEYELKKQLMDRELVAALERERAEKEALLSELAAVKAQLSDKNNSRNS